jgi:hypothetical protein
MTLALRRDGALETLCEVPAQPSGLGVLPDGRLLVVSTWTPSATPCAAHMPTAGASCAAPR